MEHDPNMMMETTMNQNKTLKLHEESSNTDVKRWPKRHVLIIVTKLRDLIEY